MSLGQSYITNRTLNKKAHWQSMFVVLIVGGRDDAVGGAWLGDAVALAFMAADRVSVG